MISGFFDPLQPHSADAAPFVSVGLVVPGAQAQLHVVRFLIDTGAGASFLSPHDAYVGVGIDPTRLANPLAWPRIDIAGALGGSQRVYVEPAQFSFFHDDGTVQVVDEEIRIIQPTPFTQSTSSGS